MIVTANFSIFFIFILSLVINGNGDRTKDRMYEKIQGSSGCYRRLNATHQIGCSSKRGGSTGVIHYCDTQEDFDFILKNGTADRYIPVIPTNLFTFDNTNKLKESGIVSGLVLYLNNDTDVFTHETQCPNDRFGIEDTCSKSKSIWNPYGTGMLYMDIPFPVFYVEKDEDIVKMKDCFVKFNNFSYDSHGERSLCSLQLNSFMYGTTNTPTCRRRSNIITNLNPVKFCDPLGDNNIWSALFALVEGPRNATTPIKNFKYVVIAARMDTTSMFEKTVGADSPVTGMVTLLSVAKLLKKILPKNNGYGKNVLFILFNGETYDYIGSQRMLYDMEQGNFPIKASENDDTLPVIKPEDISLFVELSQLSYSTDGLNAHYLHNSSEVSNFIAKLSKYKMKNMRFQDIANSLPPASLHTFLKNRTDLPGLILADHKKSYVNTFYNSIYDNAENIGYQYFNGSDISEHSIQMYISNVATMVARSVYEEVTNTSYDKDDTADVVMIDELFHCYLQNPNCKVNKAVQKAKLPKTPVSLYVGVQVISNFATTLTALALGWFTGDVVGPSNINCTNTPRNYAFKYYNMSKDIINLNETLCYKITSNSTDAVSPAFIIEDYDWSSGKYSSWAESTWEDINMRMFLRPSAAHEHMTIAIGSISMIFSFLIVYFIKSRSHVLFTPPLPTEAPTDC